ncbi:MAG: hypothetical protein WBO17_04855, partial [Sphingorhabdus sp.]
MTKSALILAPAWSMFSSVVHADTQTRATVDVSVSGIGDSNPFLEQNGDSTASGNIKIDPAVYWEDESSTVIVDGSLRLAQYTNRYGTDLGGRVGVQGNQKLDERTSMFARAGYQSTRSSIRDSFFQNTSAPLDPESFPQVALTDVTIAGSRVRVKTLDASAGVDYALSPVDQIGFSADTSYSKFGGASGTDYRTGLGRLQYGRRLSERTVFTASVEAGVADYIGQAIGDAKIISPTIGIESKLSERLRWTASVGISYASIDADNNITRNNVYLAGEFSICDAGLQSTFCGSLSRSAQPTALGGISAVTN